MVATSGATTLNSNIVGLFDAIRSKAGVSGSMTFAEAQSAVSGISTDENEDGGLSTIDQLILKIISFVPQSIANEISIIGNSVFKYCRALSIASFPNVTSIGIYAFDGCSALTTVDFPNCTYINKDAFIQCIALTSINFPKCISIDDAAFYGCPGLISVDFPECT